MTKKPRAKKPSKTAVRAAEALLAPAEMMRAVAQQLKLQVQQLDQINKTLELLAAHVKARLAVEPPPSFRNNALTEPAPIPRTTLLTESHYE